MVGNSILRRISSLGERNIFQRLLGFIEMAKESVQTLSDMLFAEDLKRIEFNAKIRNLEKRGDELSVEVKEEITGGAISSSLMDNLIMLVEKCDDLLDTSYFISRELRRIHENSHKFDETAINILKVNYSTGRNILLLARTALDHVQIMLETKNSKDMEAARVEIESLEEQVDDLKDNMIDTAYNNADKIPYVAFIHITELAHKLDNLLDNCEDIADLLFTINVAITK